jgi:hypothetical protein
VPAKALLSVPLAVALLSLPGLVSLPLFVLACAFVPTAVAEQPVQLLASAVVLAPLATALEPWPVVVVAVAVPCWTRTTPSTDLLMLPLTPFVEPGVTLLDDVVVDAEGDVVEESDDLSDGGFADATHGDAANPAPMPSATAKPPIRPTYRAYPMIASPSHFPRRPARELPRRAD